MASTCDNTCIPSIEYSECKKKRDNNIPYAMQEECALSDRPTRLKTNITDSL